MDNHSTPIDPSIGGGRVEHIGDHVLRHRYSTSLVDVTSPEQKRCTPPALGSGVWQEDVHLTISHHGKKAEVDGCPSTTNPIEANDWLRAIEKKLNLLQCNDQEKVAFATHQLQLQGPASVWWDNYMVTRPAGTEVTWIEFCQSFNKAQVPEGIVAQKKREFRSLQQGTRTVIEYLHEFNRLTRYAPEDVRTDAERQEKFLSGLDDELTNQLISQHYEDFQKLVDKAIRQEEQCNKMNRKRKAVQFRTSQGISQKPRLTMGHQGGPSTMIIQQHRPYHPGSFDKNYHSGSHNNSEQHSLNPTPSSLMNVAQSALPAQPEQPKKFGEKPDLCFNCNEPGHMAAGEEQEVAVEKTTKKLEDIPIDREYPEVFPDDLTTMPPKRDIEFRIDLAPGTAPIHKRPYRMGANELAEVKKQVDEQLQKGYIRPSTLPWGAPEWTEAGNRFMSQSRAWPLRAMGKKLAMTWSSPPAASMIVV
ncbi:uncharacterized protein [Oryza sativa Japonica Group]|uniref:uncharacterized protein n=1 Tax=Oryza sativa subsp. japonica TaxID=39947 RepID=UPI00339CA35C